MLRTTRGGALLARVAVALMTVVAALGAAFGGVPTTARAETYAPACSAAALIAAIDDANSSPAGSRIVLAPGCTYTLTSVNNTGANGPNGLPVITAAGGPLVIVGYGATIERSSALGTPNFRHFEVEAGAQLFLRDLTLSGGNPGTTNLRGGAIVNDGLLQILGVTLRNNRVGTDGGSGVGGALGNLGSLSIIRSVLVDNVAGDDAGAIYSGDPGVNSADLVIESTTIARNAANGSPGVGAGILAHNSNVSLNSVTITANVAGGGGVAGGIATFGTGSYTINNSIISGNLALTQENCAVVPDVNSANNIEDGTSCSGFNNANPDLTADGSGLFYTIGAASPARDAGNTPGCGLDQRSIYRLIDGACDLGAVEFGDGSATIAFDDPGLVGQSGTAAEAALNSAYNPRGVSFDALREVNGPDQLATDGNVVTVLTDPTGADMLITFAYPVEFVSVDYVVTGGQRNSIIAREGNGTAATIENSDDPLVGSASSLTTGQLSLSGQCIRTLQVENEAFSFDFDNLTFRLQPGKDINLNGIVDACDYTQHVVTNTADTGPGSLYQAILDANAEPDPSLISFLIPGAGQQVFTGSTPRPQITTRVKIDGYTQSGAGRNTLAQGWNGVIQLELNGNASNTIGLDFGPGSEGSVVRGFEFSAHSTAIRIAADNVLVTGNLIGVNEAGDPNNNQVGVDVDGGTGVTIGGPSPSRRNVITGNGNQGIRFNAGGGTVENNYIGTTPAGEEPASLFAYNGTGIELQGASATIRNNLISNNIGRGILVGGAASSGTVIAGNIIGLNAAGLAQVANGIGVELVGGATNVIIGGAAAANRNLIAGSSDPDIVVRDTADGNTIRGNWIGVNATGNVGYGSFSFLTDGSTVLIEGDNTLVEGNVIGPAQGSTLKISSGNSTIVRNNLIGTNAAGDTGLGSILHGVEISGSSANNAIGTPGQGNLIAGNGLYGVLLDGFGVAGTLIQGNRIGINAADQIIENGSFFDGGGIRITNGAAGTLIGGPLATARNIIAGNFGDGINISSGGSGTVIAGNYIGTDNAGLNAVANIGDGVEVANTGGVTIGGSTAAAGNLIGGNNQEGIWIQGFGAGNVIRYNRIGLGSDGLADVGNFSNGIMLFSGAGGVTVSDNTLAYNNFGMTVFSNGNTFTGNTITQNDFQGIQLTGANNSFGGTTAAERNIVTGNGQNGISLTGAGATGNVIEGNYIGIRADGVTADGNTNSGISVSGGAANNTIGGPNAADGNLIAFNGSTGLRIEGGSGNRMLSNLVYANGGGNVLLLGGANSDAPAATVTTAIPGFPAAGQSNVQGWLTGGAPSTLYTVQLFSGNACTAGGAGEARALLDTFNLTTALDGTAPFTRTLPGAFSAGTFVSAIATGAAGSSPLAICAPVGPDNTVWYQAIPLTGPTDNESQPIALSEQVRWYYVEVGPRSRVAVTLNNLPAGYDLALFNDLNARAEELVAGASANLTTTVALAQTEIDYTAIESSNFITNSLAPELYSPEAFTARALSTVNFRPDVIAEAVASPFKASPFKASPFKASPFKASPFKASPFKASPFKASPFKASDLAGIVVDTGLLSYTDIEGTLPRTLTLNTFTESGRVYIAVYGRNGAFNPASNFTLTASTSGAACLNIAPPGPSVVGLPAVTGNFQSLFLTDLGERVDPVTGERSLRLPGTEAERAALLQKIATLRLRPEVNGAPLVRLDLDPRVVAANSIAEQNLNCPEAKNLVANEIKALIERYRAANPGLRYVTLIGGDEVIPYFRYADQALLGNESEFEPPVRNDSASEAALRLGYILGQDEYGARFTVNFRGVTLAIPDLAVGRLVESAAEATTMIDSYLATGGVITPQRSFVSGYDFHYESSLTISETMRLGTGAPVDGLLSPSTDSYQFPGTWTATDLRNALIARDYSLYYLAGHFSDGALKAADYATVLRASELLGAGPTRMAGALVVSPGCHSGYNTPDGAAISGATEQPDWAQFFARRGTALVAGTGYQYGDTQFTQFAEELYARYFEQLRIDAFPNDPRGNEVSIGDALVVAKQRYLIDSAVIRGIDKKTLTISTLFGLPMARVNMQGERLGPQPAPVIPADLNPQPIVLNDPFALTVDTVTITPTLAVETLNLTSLNSDGTPGATLPATYVRGATADDVVARPGEPVLPLAQYSVGVSGEQVRGALYLTGTYTLLPNVLPLTGAPATELRGVHMTFPTEAYYPEKWWSLNSFGELTGDTSAARSQLQLTPSQFLANAGSIRGTLRYYNGAQQFRLFYSNGAAADLQGLDPALYGAPAIPAVSFTRDGALVNFQVSANGGGVPVREVWVTFTADAGPLAGRWQSLQLTSSADDPSLYLGSLTLPEGTGGFSFFAQAANAAGFTALNTNLGLYFQAGGFVNGAFVTPPPAPVVLPVANAAATTLSLGLPSGATFGRPATFTADLTAGGAGLTSQPLTLRVGSQTVTATTGANGRASFTLTLFGAGQLPVEVTYGGTSAYKPSSAGATLSVAKQQPALAVTPAGPSVAVGVPLTLTATLTDLDGGIRDARLYLSVGGQVVSARTGPDGTARLPVPAFAVGSYPFTVTYLRIPTAGGGFLSETDPRYLQATATGNLSVTDGLVVVAPTTTTGQVPYADRPALSDIAATALLSGTLNPRGATTTAYFEWRLASATTYPTTQRVVVTGTFTGTNPVQVRASLTGLRPGTLYTYRLVATNSAGTTLGNEVTFRTRYNFKGFFQPVDNLPALNRANAGRTIPVKFSLGGNFGLDIFEPGFPRVVTINCTTGVVIDEIELYDPALLKDELDYSESDKEYRYKWVTERSWAGTCRQFVVRFNDGTEVRANFQFRR